MYEKYKHGRRQEDPNDSNCIILCRHQYCYHVTVRRIFKPIFMGRTIAEKADNSASPLVKQQLSKYGTHIRVFFTWEGMIVEDCEFVNFRRMQSLYLQAGLLLSTGISLL